MTGARIFLGLSVLLWIPYGIYCFVQPGALAEAAGVVSTSATGSTELRAMYGGLQVAIGSLALAGFLREKLVASALLAIAFLCGGLFSARLLGLFIDGGLSAYTGLGLAFEATSLFFALFLSRGGEASAA